MSKRKVHIFIPCFVDQLFPATAFNMIKILEKANCEIVYNTNQTCCGQPAFNAGFIPEAKAVAQKFRNDFKDAECVVSPSASCTGFIRNYIPSLFNEDKEQENGLSTKSFEFTEFLTDELGITDLGARFPVKATYHDSCAGLRECHIKQGPRKLLENVAGLELVEMADNETCCGFGGTFAVKFEPISIAMAEQKIGHAMDTGATHIISTDWSCLMHIDAVARKKSLPISCLHIADVLAEGW